VRNNEVWIGCMQLVDKSFQHLPFSCILRNQRGSFLFNSLWKVRRERHLVEFPHKCEILIALFISIAILVDLVVSNERDDCDLACVLTRTSNFEV
jgi:hypothetical protein